MIIKQKLYVHEIYGNIKLDANDMSGFDSYTPLGEVTVEIEFAMPTKLELRDKKLEVLYSKRHLVEARAQTALERIQSEIQKLMALEAPANSIQSEIQKLMARKAPRDTAE